MKYLEELSIDQQERYWDCFDVIENGPSIPVSYKEASWHLVWEVKKHLTCKACCIKDEHKYDYPDGLNFAGIVSRKNIRTIFDVDALKFSVYL